MTEEKQNLLDTTETIEPTTETVDNQAQSKREKMKQKQQAANELLARLSVEYPNVFPKAGQGRAVPLAIGMHKVLQPIVAEWGFNSMTLRAAMFNYTRQLRYQNALLYATHRLNLDGSQAEEIPQEQKDAAKEEIAKIEAWLAKNKPEKAQRLSEKKAQFAEKKQQARTTKPKQRKPQGDKPFVKKEAKAPQVRQETKTESTPKNLDEKMQGLLSKFNQY